MSIEHNNTLLLIQAAKHGDAIEVERLIPLSIPKAFDSEALRYAARNGHTDCVRLLTPVSDSKTRNNYALRLAAFHGHTDCVDLLFDVSDTDVALKRLKTEFIKTPEIWQYLEDKITARRQRALLMLETAYVSSTVKSRKI